MTQTVLKKETSRNDEKPKKKGETVEIFKKLQKTIKNHKRSAKSSKKYKKNEKQHPNSKTSLLLYNSKASSDYVSCLAAIVAAALIL